jgi:AbrB family looped-hinge helix DNA binding protein
VVFRLTGWYLDAMRTTIDSAGRVVIPKSLREAIGLGDGGEIEIQLVDGALLVAPPTVGKRVETRDGRATIVAEEDLPPLPDRVVRDVLDAVRR